MQKMGIRSREQDAFRDEGLLRLSPSSTRRKSSDGNGMLGSPQCARFRGSPSTVCSESCSPLRSCNRPWCNFSSSSLEDRGSAPKLTEVKPARNNVHGATAATHTHTQARTHSRAQGVRGWRNFLAVKEGLFRVKWASVGGGSLPPLPADL